MNLEVFRNHCLSHIGVTEDCAFGDETVLFRICNKIFACVDLNRPHLAVAKCDPDLSIDLRDRHSGIRPAWHWNKRHWIDIYFDEDVPDDVILSLIDKAYWLVRTSLPKKTLYNFPDLPSGWHHEHFPELVSTMDCISDYESDSPFLLITTDFQTKGRGQATNSWESEKGANLLFSMRFSPTRISAGSQFLVSQVIALSIVEALKRFLGNEVLIKWPNDIYYKGKKICGILIDHKLSGLKILSTTIGVGINVNQQSFPLHLPNPVSLFQILGKEVDRAALLRNIIKSFCGFYEKAQNNPERIRKMYLERLFLLDVPARYKSKGRSFIGTITGTDDNGQLTVSEEGGASRSYGFKEIEYTLEEGSAS